MKNTFLSSSYLQSPEIFNDQIILKSDDDLWKFSLSSKKSIRLTQSRGSVSDPKVSPDQKLLAYRDTEMGQSDIYLTSTDGGKRERLTYCGVINLCGWKDQEHLLFSSHAESFSPRVSFLYLLNIKTKEIKKLPYGHAKVIQYTKGKSVLGRNNGDPARWKRYRGGTAGTLWIDKTGRGEFKKILKEIPSNLSNPLWIEYGKGKQKREKLFFISDHEGIGNIYSCKDDGTDLRRHTNSDKYYIRSFSAHHGKIAYQCAAEIFTYDIETEKTEQLKIPILSSFNQAIPRIEDSEYFLQEFHVNQDGTEICFITRGQIYLRSPWSGAPLSLGDREKRYKHPLFLNSAPKKGKTKDEQEKLLLVELNKENEEKIKLFTFEKYQYRKPQTLFPQRNWGKIESLCPHPQREIVALTNNRNQLFLMDLRAKKCEEIGHSKDGAYLDLTWSPCGNFLAYSAPLNRAKRGIHLYNLREKKERILIPSILNDSCPTFSPCGKYLYFIGIREFHPNYAESHFELSFPFARQIYVLTLQRDLESPLELYDNGDPLEPHDHDGPNKERGEQKNSPPPPLEIDWEGIESRILPLPLPMGGHLEISCIEDKLFILKDSIKGLNPSSHEKRASGPHLYTYSLREKKFEIFQKSCSSFEITKSQKHILMSTEDGLRLVSTEGRPHEGNGYNRKDGFLNLQNLRLLIDPKKEWKQMYQEAWILQREQFWTEDMSKINWKNIYLHYLPLLDKVHTREELSDLLWEMQGELGTSHCYEFGGDYNRRPPLQHRNAQLGATLKWNSQTKIFTILDLPHGDSWIGRANSPLRATGVQLNKGDHIIGIDGRAFSRQEDLSIALMGREHQKILLEVKRKGKKKSENEYLDVTPRHSYHLTHYRDWVNHNKDYVHKKTKGKVGYIHIPDMGIHGLSEFYRNYLTECLYEGLIVDVRYNGGGHVSQHILKILAQKVLGLDQTRHMGREPYPLYAVNGPVVALTNEHAGSDGDIFSHSFKLMNIGPLIGKRTWGGVIGISPHYDLNDGTITTQPEFSFWFKDVGYKVENYGTDPDIEVENTPANWRDGLDAQLDRSIEEVLKLQKKNPPLKPNLDKGRPNLKAPRLPKSKQ